MTQPESDPKPRVPLAIAALLISGVAVAGMVESISGPTEQSASDPTEQADSHAESNQNRADAIARSINETVGTNRTVKARVFNGYVMLPYVNVPGQYYRLDKPVILDPETTADLNSQTIGIQTSDQDGRVKIWTETITPASKVVLNDPANPFLDVNVKAFKTESGPATGLARTSAYVVDPANPNAALYYFGSYQSATTGTPGVTIPDQP